MKEPELLKTNVIHHFLSDEIIFQLIQNNNNNNNDNNDNNNWPHPFIYLFIYLFELCFMLTNIHIKI